MSVTATPFMIGGDYMRREGTKIKVFYLAYYNDGRVDERVYTSEYSRKLTRRECDFEYKSSKNAIMGIIDDPNIIDVELLSAEYYGLKR